MWPANIFQKIISNVGWLFLKHPVEVKFVSFVKHND